MTAHPEQSTLEGVLSACEFFLSCHLDQQPCPNCDPGAEGAEIAGEIIRKVWEQQDAHGLTPKYRERLMRR